MRWGYGFLIYAVRILYFTLLYCANFELERDRIVIKCCTLWDPESEGAWEGVGTRMQCIAVRAPMTHEGGGALYGTLKKSVKSLEPHMFGASVSI